MLGLGSSRIDDPQLKARRELFRCCSGLTSGEHRGLDICQFSLLLGEQVVHYTKGNYLFETGYMRLRQQKITS